MPPTTRITAADLAARISSGIAPAILDVRSRREYKQGHVPGATHIPFWRLPADFGSLTASRDEPLVVYCGHGPRAWTAAAVLRRAGFRSVALLEGHMTGWLRAGLPVERS